MQIRKIKLQTKTILAPMAWVTNEDFRIISHELGDGLVYAERVSDEAIVQKNQKTIKMIKVNPLEHLISM